MVKLLHQSGQQGSRKSLSFLSKDAAQRPGSQKSAPCLRSPLSKASPQLLHHLLGGRQARATLQVKCSGKTCMFATILQPSAWQTVSLSTAPRAHFWSATWCLFARKHTRFSAHLAPSSSCCRQPALDQALPCMDEEGMVAEGRQSKHIVGRTEPLGQARIRCRGCLRPRPCI